MNRIKNTLYLLLSLLPPSMDTDFESVLLVIRECFGKLVFLIQECAFIFAHHLLLTTKCLVSSATTVYKIPPRTAARGYR